MGTRLFIRSEVSENPSFGGLFNPRLKSFSNSQFAAGENLQDIDGGTIMDLPHVSADSLMGVFNHGGLSVVRADSETRHKIGRVDDQPLYVIDVTHG